MWKSVLKITRYIEYLNQKFDYCEYIDSELVYVWLNDKCNLCFIILIMVILVLEDITVKFILENKRAILFKYFSKWNAEEVFFYKYQYLI